MIKRFFLIILLFSIFTTNVIAQAGIEINTEKLEAMTAPTYARIYTKTCAKFTSGVSYEQCLITIGDGVYISADGYILTNSQIGKHTVDDVADRMLSTQDGAMFYVTNIYPKTDGAQTLNETAALALIDQILSGDEFRVQAVENVMATVNSNKVVVDILSEVSYVEKDGVGFAFDENQELTNSSENLEVSEVFTLNIIQFKKEDNSPVVLKVETEDHPSIKIDNVEFDIESNYFKQGEAARSGSGLVTAPANRELAMLNGPTIIDTVQDFAGKLINQSEPDKQTDKLFLLAGDGRISAVHGSFKVYNDFDEYYFNNEYLNQLLTTAEIAVVDSKTDGLWRNAVNAYFEDDFDASIQLFDQILNIYPEHQSAKFYKQRAELQVVTPTTDQTDNQILLFLRQYISSDITEEQIPVILGSIVGGFVAIIFALFFIKKLFNKKDKLPKMPDPQSQIKDENDLIQNDLPEPVMQQAAVPITSGGALPVLEETKSQPHEPVQNLNMNDKNMPVQAVEQTLSGNPSAPIVPMMGTQVMPHPEEKTPDLVEEMHQQNIQNSPVNDSAPIMEDSLQSKQSEAMPEGRQVGSLRSEEEQITPVQPSVLGPEPIEDLSNIQSNPMVQQPNLNTVEEPVVESQKQEENQWPAIQPSAMSSQHSEQSGIRSQESGVEPQAPVLEPIVPVQSNNSGYRIIDDEPDEIEALVEDMAGESTDNSQQSTVVQSGISDQQSVVSSQSSVTEEAQQPTVDNQQIVQPVLEPEPVVSPVIPIVEEATADQMPGLLRLVEEPEQPSADQPIIEEVKPVEQPAVSDQPSAVQPIIEEVQESTVQSEKVEKTLPPIPVQPSAVSNQSSGGQSGEEQTAQPIVGEILTEEEQRRRDKKRERRKRWREKRKMRRQSEVGSLPDGQAGQKSESDRQSASQESGVQSTTDSQQSNDNAPVSEPVESTEDELPDWLKPVE